MANTAHLSDYEWLVSPSATRWLNLASQCDSEFAGLSRLRKELSPERSRLVMEQVVARKRAARKFDHARGMFFTPLRLEQATSHSLATYKVGLFPSGEIADLCCGIGGDAIALAAVRKTTAVDRDPVCCILAKANAEVCGVDLLHVECADACDFPVENFAAWHMDPDRRPFGRRTTDALAHEPNDRAVDDLLSRNNDAAIKFAPAARIPNAWQESAELVWLGEDRECKQMVACFGRMADSPGSHRAVIVGHDGQPLASFSGRPHEMTELREIEDYIVEPHATIRAAGLSGSVARQMGLGQVATETRYFTSSHAIGNAGLACFRVLDQLPFDRKRVKAALGSLNAGRVEFKTCRTGLDPSQEAKKLRTKGERTLTVFVVKTRIAMRCVIAERCGRG